MNNACVHFGALIRLLKKTHLIMGIFFILFIKGAGAEEYKLTQLITGSDGHSYFKELSLDFHPGTVGFISDDLKPKLAIIGHAGPGEQGLHNAPGKVAIVVLSGVMQIETSKNIVKNFKAGEILLAEDTSGLGHKSRSLENKPVSYLLIKRE